MFCVYDNDKPCSVEGFKVHESWKTHKFETFKEALEYLKDWLGDFDTLPDNYDGQPYEYGSYGDTVKIVEE